MGYLTRCSNSLTINAFTTAREEFKQCPTSNIAASKFNRHLTASPFMLHPSKPNNYFNGVMCHVAEKVSWRATNANLMGVRRESLSFSWAILPNNIIPNAVIVSIDSTKLTISTDDDAVATLTVTHSVEDQQLAPISTMAIVSLRVGSLVRNRPLRSRMKADMKFGQ